MTKDNLSAFEENIYKAYCEITLHKNIRNNLDCFDNLDIAAEKTYAFLVAKGQMPDQLRVDYIKKVLDHFKNIQLIGQGLDYP